MKYLLYILLFVINNNVKGQINFKGIVLENETKQIIAFANIQYKSTGKIIQTNENGTFLLNATSLNDTIIISSIGYKTVIAVLNKNSYNIVYLNKSKINLGELATVSSSNFNNQIINKIDLSLRPVKSSQDLLKLVPGLFIAQHQGGGKAEQLFLRGFDIDHGTDIQIVVDGMPVNMVSHAHGQGYADLHFLIPELVKKIEYGKGPYTASQGNLGTAGYVNFTTLKKLEKNTISLDAGQFNTFRSLVMLDLIKNKPNKNAYVAGEYLFSNGPFLNKQKLHRINLFSKYTQQLNNNTNIEFLSSYFKSNWNASGQLPERAVNSGIVDRFGAIDSTEAGATDRFNASLLLKKQLKKGSFEQQVFFNNYNFNLFSNFTFYLNDSINGDQIKQAEKRNIFGYNGALKLNSNSNKYYTTIGYGVRIDNVKNSELTNTKEKTIVLKNINLGNIVEKNYFTYIDQKIFFNKFELNPAIRFDVFSFNYFDKLTNQKLPQQIRLTTSPKLNINYNYSNKLQFFIKTGKGFHSNDTRAVTVNDGSRVLPAAVGSDIGFTARIKKSMIFNMAVWYMYLQNELVYVGDEGITEVSGRTKRVGIDMATHIQLHKNIILDATVNIAKPRSLDNIKGENFIPLAPTLTKVIGASYVSNIGLSMSLRMRHMQNRAANETNTVIAKGYTLYDYNIAYKTKKYEFGINVENVLNTKWNEAQFNTNSRLKNETNAIEEIHFTPGIPTFVKLKFVKFF